MNKKFILFLPLILLLSVCLLLFVGLHKDPKQIASALINKPVPDSIKQIYLNRVKLSAREIFPKNLSCLMCGEVGVAIANKNTLF